MNAAVFLGIETSSTDTGVALVDADQVLFEAVEPGVNHNEVLLAIIDRAFKTTRLSLKELTGIGVTIGPGMFTSLRVGLSTAKGLAIAHGIPVKGINTLSALAAAASEPGKPVLTVMDARKHQVYAGLYQDGRPLLSPTVHHPEELGKLVAGFTSPGSALLVAGSGTSLCLPHLERLKLELHMTGVQTPPPRTIARLAAQSITNQGGDDIERLAPLYLRRTDAELQREKRTGGGV